MAKVFQVESYENDALDEMDKCVGVFRDMLDDKCNELCREREVSVATREMLATASYRLFAPQARIADLERQLQEAVGLFKELRGTIKAASHRLEEAANSGVRFLGTHGLLVTGLRKIDDFVKGSPNGE